MQAREAFVLGWPREEDRRYAGAKTDGARERARDVACGHRTMAGGQRPLIGINRSVTRAYALRRSPDLASTVCTRLATKLCRNRARAATHGEENNVLALCVLPSRDPMTSISYIVSAVQINDRNVK